jgi:hypothetical protein
MVGVREENLSVHHVEDIIFGREHSTPLSVTFILATWSGRTSMDGLL